MPSGIVNGAAGDSWTNNTSHVMEQLVCSLVNTCAYCLPLHLQVAPYWPTPFHRNCRCRVVRVFPGETSHPFVDFTEVFDGMPRPQRNRLVGTTIAGLLDRGVIDWSDVVSPDRIRTLGEIIARRKLGESDLLDAGMSPRRAAKALLSARPDSDVASRSASKLAEILSNQGLSIAEVFRHTGVVLLAKRATKPMATSPPIRRRLTPPVALGVPGGFAWPFLVWRDDEEITPEEAMRILAFALGFEKAKTVDPLPLTVRELDAVLAREGSLTNAASSRAIMQKLGIK